jgi:ribosomal protein S18 acetylase RimI-like enzyme
MKLEIRPLSPDLKEDYLSFFDSIKFEEHPHWADCYCYSFHFTGKAEEWLRERNRSCVSSMIEEGSMKGYLAYSDDKPVAWCNVNNRLNYQLLIKTYELIEPAHEKICSIVCFLVHPEYRRLGILQLLLDRIIVDYSSLDYDFIEAYPRSGSLSEENLYRGPLDLLTRNGFERVKEFPEYNLVRKSL